MLLFYEWFVFAGDLLFLLVMLLFYEWFVFAGVSSCMHYLVTCF